MSTTFHNMQNQTRTTVTPPPSPLQHQHNNNPRLKLLPGDVCVGCIVWLPPLKPRNAAIYCTKASCANEEMEEGGYDHPVVVLRIRQRENSSTLGDLICTVAIMSTFRNTSLPRYQARKAKDPRFRHSMPMYNQSPESEEDTLSLPALDSNLLYLEKRTLKKQGYVRYDHTFDIPVKYLRTYGYRDSYSRAYKFRLREESYARLMGKLRLPQEVYERTNTLFETEIARLAALASPETLVAIPRILPVSEGLPFNGAITDIPGTDHVVSARAENHRYGTIGSEPVTRIVLPRVQQRELPIYVNRWPALRSEDASGGGEEDALSWVKFGTYFFTLAGVGLLVRWFWA